jgi:hypothetical protein
MVRKSNSEVKGIRTTLIPVLDWIHRRQAKATNNNHKGFKMCLALFIALFSRGIDGNER